MPTYECLPAFSRDHKKLSEEDKEAFSEARKEFVVGVRTGQFLDRLGVKKMKGHKDIWEMAWALDGRATFHYGIEKISGEKHVVWRRIGTHKIYDQP